MYRQHWNLTRKPFTTAYESELIFFREPFAEAYHTLTLASRLAPANLWVIGEKGVGKTTLLRKVEEALTGELSIIMLAGKFLNERSALLDLLEKSGAFSVGTQGMNLETRMTDHFRSGSGQSKPVLIVVDDADLVLNQDALSDLVRLQELGTANDWPLTTLYSGRVIPEQLRPGGANRITELLLPQPSRHECGEILEHRLAISGSTTTVFTPSALERLVSRSHGDLYTLLTMADLCLQVGSVAKVHTIDDELVRNKVEPFLERFFKDGKESRETASPHLENAGGKTLVATVPGGAAVSNADVPAQSTNVTASRISPVTLGPQRLVSQAELETYRASSISEAQRNNIQKLAQKIARGEINVAESLGEYEKTEVAKADSPDTPSPEEAQESIEKLDPTELYHAGVATIRQVLNSLRNKQYTDLTPVENLATTVVNSINESFDLLYCTLNQDDSTELHTHLMNVGVLCAVVAKELKLKEERRPELVQIAMIHDVGHLHCGEELLLSENRFDRKDFKAIKQHPIVGRDLILKYTNGSELMADVISQEHERDDGLGYPNYLDDKGIHLYAKIIGVCDVFEALSHSRAHRRALTPEEAIVNLNATMLRRTDPRIVRALHRAVLVALAG